MTDPILQLFIPAIMLVAIWLVIFWKKTRKGIRVIDTSPSLGKEMEYKRIKKGNFLFWIIFYVFGIMTIIYSIIPELYYIFFPLDMFHKPVINVIGLLLMKIAIVWIIIAQIKIDKELNKISNKAQSLSPMGLVQYSERMLLTGILVLFIGLFTTITNLIGMVLVVFGIAIYLYLFCLNNKSLFKN